MARKFFIDDDLIVKFLEDILISVEDKKDEVDIISIFMKMVDSIRLQPLADQYTMGLHIDYIFNVVSQKIPKYEQEALSKYMYIFSREISKKFLFVSTMRQKINQRIDRKISDECLDVALRLEKFDVDLGDADMDILKNLRKKPVETMVIFKNLLTIRSRLQWKKCTTSEDFKNFFSSLGIEESMWRSVQKMHSLKLYVPGSRMYRIDLSWIADSIRKDERFVKYSNFIAFLDGNHPVEICSKYQARKAIESEARRVSISIDQLLRLETYEMHAKKSPLLRSTLKFGMELAYKKEENLTDDDPSDINPS